KKSEERNQNGSNPSPPIIKKDFFGSPFFVYRERNQRKETKTVRILLRPLLKRTSSEVLFSYTEKEIRGKKPKRFESFSAHYLRGLLRKSFFFGSKDGRIKILQG
ncbi:hypothetical protein, partial [uncultured Eubacterium sp.]|uniref:hypothetical protein n=1 Tax=uncultured Eubacterium sp. TaxID=165185 RepID=UPI0026261536